MSAPLEQHLEEVARARAFAAFKLLVAMPERTPKQSDVMESALHAILADERAELLPFNAPESRL